MLLGNRLFVAPVFVATWLTANTLLATRAARAAFGVSPWALNFGFDGRRMAQDESTAA
jgi:hypothetical protein